MAQKKLRIIILFLALFAVDFSYAAEAKEKKSTFAAFWWSFFVPGGGHFYLGETGKALGYFAGTASLVGWGIAVNDRKAGGELNTPLLYAQQLHSMQIYTSYREATKRLDGNPDKKILKDLSSLSDLALSPFRRENLKNPWVIGFALLGAGVNYAIVRLDEKNRDYSDIRSVQILGSRFNRETGLAAYSAYWIPVSLGAGVSEETIFRGMIQTEWEDRWGKKRGLLASSALFGAAHYNGSGESVPNMLFAGAAGLFLGWRFQERDYKLSESIAEHFWFNLFAGVTLYLAAPEDNPLGAKVEWSF